MTQESRGGQEGCPNFEQLEQRLLLNGVLPDPFAIQPFGSLAYQTSTEARMEAGGEVDEFTIDLDAQQTITAVVDGLDPTLDVSVAIKDPSSTTIATADVSGPGLRELIQTVATPVSGTYTIAVTQVSGSGDYNLSVLVNAAFDDGSSDGSPAAAQDIGESFLDLGAGVQRGAVVADMGSTLFSSYSFDLTAGETVSLALASHAYVDAFLGLYGVSGELLASGQDGSASLKRMIVDVAAPTTGTYYARVVAVQTASVVDGQLSLIVVRNGNFDAERNDTLAAGQEITSTGAVLGSVGLTPMNRLFIYEAYHDQMMEIDPQSGETLISRTVTTYSSRISISAAANSLLYTKTRYLGQGVYRYSLEQTVLGDLTFDPASLGLTRPVAIDRYNIALWGDEIFARSVDTAQQVDVLDYATGSLERTFTLDSHLTGKLLSGEAGLYMIVGSSLHQVDRWTGEGTLLGELDLAYGYYSAAIMGDELFVTGDSPPTNGVVGVYDLDTLVEKRTLQLLDHDGNGYLYYRIGAGAGSRDDDYYTVQVNAGDTLTLETTTPGDGAYGPANILDPLIELYDPAGVLVATDDNGAADGRNASLVYSAATGGWYTVCVRSADQKRGDYLLTISDRTVEPDPFVVAATNIPDGVRLDYVPYRLRVDFSADVQLSSLDASDVTIGGLPADAYSLIDSDTVAFDLPVLGIGTFALDIPAGAILDKLNQPIEAYHAEVIVSALSVPPVGSLTYAHHTRDSIAAGSPSKSLGLQLDAGQILTIVVSPLFTDLHVSLELRDTGGQTIATASPSASGEAGLIQDIPIGVSGEYRLTISAVGGTAGSFDLDVMLNASAEEEPYTASDNDDPVSAQNIDGSFVDLAGNGVRGAVIGEIEAGKSTSVVSEDFESGSFGPAWTPSGGGLEVTDAWGAATGDYAMMMRNKKPGIGPILHEAVWSVDLTGQGEVRLEFSFGSTYGGRHFFDGDFIGHALADGVAISDDGVHWHPIWDMPESIAGWQRYSIDLTSEVIEAGMEFGETFRIKFQQHGMADPNGWHGWDDIDIVIPRAKDTYAFHLDAGDTVGLALNPLGDSQVRLEMLDSLGNTLAAGAGGLANFGEVITDFVAPDSGTYYARVTGADHSRYLLAVARNAHLGGEPNDDFYTAQDITRTGVALGATSNDTGGQYDPQVDWYSFAVNPGDTLSIATSTPADGPDEFFNVADPVIELYGPDGALIATDDNSAADGRNALITHAASSGGLYRVKISDADSGGEYVLRVSGHTGSTVGPFTAVAQDLPDGAILAEPPKWITLSFSDLVRLDSLAASDLEVDGVSAAGLLVVDGRTIRFHFSSLAAGHHAVTIGTGALVDLQGTPIEPFTSTFTVPAETRPIEPLGSLIYEQGIDGFVTVSGDSALYEMELDADQTLTVIVEGHSSMEPWVDLYDPQGNLLGEAVATAPGETAMLQTIPIVSEGSYHLEIGGALGSIGDFSARILLNAAVEEEDVAGGATNNDLSSAQDLGSSFISLGAGASRGAVIGHVGTLYREDFEDGQLSANWSIYSSRNRHTIGSVEGFNPPSGEYALLLSNDNDRSLAEATWSVDLSDLNEATLSFWHRNNRDGEEPFDGPFADHFDADGIAISADGVNWHPIWEPRSQKDGRWIYYVVDLSSLVENSGLTLSADFHIRFQTYSRYGGLDRIWDNVLITDRSESDYYRFMLQASEQVTFVSRGDGIGSTQSQLVDSAGVLLAEGITGSTSLDDVVAEFVAPYTGMYYAKVNADPVATDYTLVVVRNATFDIEPNNDPLHAQEITAGYGALGEVGTGLGRLFVLDDRSRIRELDPLTGATIDEKDPIMGEWRQGVATSDITVLAGGMASMPIYEFDPDTLEIIRELPHPITGPYNGISGMAYLENEIFVKDDGQTVHVLDYWTGEHLRTFVIDRGTAGLAATSEALLGVQGTTIYQIDPFTGSTTVTGEIGAAATSLGVIGNLLYAGTNEYDSVDSIRVYDLGTFELLRIMYVGLPHGIGADGGVTADLYNIEVDSGDMLSISTLTPADGSGMIDNRLDPWIRVYDPNGNLVAGDDNSAPDGRNAVLLYEALQDGTYTIRVSAVANTSGEYVLHVSGNTGTSDQPFAVISSDPADGTVWETRPTQFVVDFSDGVNLSTLDLSDLTVGGIPATGYSIVDGNTIAFDLPHILRGVHDIAIAAGSIVDIQGTPVEGFTAQITVGEFEFPIPLTAIEPHGSQVYHGVVDGTIEPVGDTNSFTIELDAGQKLSVIVESDISLQSVVHLYDSSEGLVDTGMADGPGQTALIQAASITFADVYQIVIGGANGSTGEFTLRVLLNTAIEHESVGGPYSNDMSTAQDLAPALRDLASGGQTGSLIGNIMTSPYEEDFERGGFGPGWTTYSSTGGGHIRVERRGETGTNGYALVMDESPSVFTLNEAIWTVDLTYIPEAALRFSYYRWGDQYTQDEFTGPFADHYNADGIAISTDNVNWHPVFTPPVEVQRVWTESELDLTAIAAAAGLSLDSTLHIKFQQYGNGRIGDDGLMWDDIVVTAAHGESDWYRLSLSGGENVDIWLTQLNMASTQLSLHDESGVLLRDSSPGPGTSSGVIDSFVAPSAADYYIRVNGDAPQYYSLLVVAGMKFNHAIDDQMGLSLPITAGDVISSAVLPIGDPLDYEIELNDLVADPFSPEGASATDLTGDFALVGGNTYEAHIEGYLGSHSGDTDIFQFPASPGDVLTASWRDEHGYVISPDSMHILDRAGRRLSVTTTSYVATCSDFTYTGAYYVQLPGRWPSPQYRLTLALETDRPLWEHTDGYYHADLDLGVALIVRTSTPGSAPGQFVNELDPIIELYDPAGVLVSDDDNGEDDGRNSYLRYAAREDGPYTAVISGVGNTSGEYILTIDTQEPAATRMWVVSISPPDDGLIDAPVTQILAEFSHAVDTSSLEASDLLLDGSPTAGWSLIDPYTVAFDIPGILQDGVHTVAISAGTIDHVYGNTNEAFTSQFNFDAPPMIVIGTDPSDGHVDWKLPGQITVDFSQPILTASLDASDLRFGGLAATGMTIVDADTATFDLPGGLGEGEQAVTIAAGAVIDIYGQPIVAYAGSFNYSPAPRVIASSIDRDEILSPGTIVYVTRFDKPLDESVLGISDFELGSPTQSRGADLFSYDEVSSTLTVTFDDVAEGTYTLTLHSGSDAIKSIHGFELDGEPDPVSQDGTPSGNGIPGGDFVVSFEADVSTLPIPAAFQPVLPLGSLAYESLFGGLIGSIGDTDSFTVDADPGQTLTIVIDPDSALTPAVELFDPSSVSIGNATSGAAGESAVLQTVPVAGGGTYTLTVAGAAATKGAYTVRLMLNSAVEDEEYGGPANDDWTSAQDLDAGFTEITGTAGRVTVVGSLPDPYGIPVITEGFEGLGLGAEWSTYSSDPEGRITVTDAYGAAKGSNALWMDRETMGAVYTLNEAVWTLDLSSVAAPILSFWHAEYMDEIHSFSGDFTGHYDADGIAISDDGVNWHPIWDGSNLPRGVWEHYIIDLEAEAASAGMSLGAEFRIKFQQFDNYPLTSDGRGWDEVAIRTPSMEGDWYSVSLTAGESATIAAVGDDVSVELYNSGGVVVATGTRKAQNLASVIPDFVPRSSGPHYIRLSGHLDYSMVVTRGAVFEMEDNASLDMGQTVTSTGTVLGAVEEADSDFYSFAANSGDALIISTLTPGDQPGEFVNNLDPAIELYDPSGTLIAGDDNSAADGRNALLTHTAASSGTYVVRLSASAGTGEYALEVLGHTGALETFRVEAADPADGERVALGLQHIVIDFSDVILLSSLDAGDLTIDGAPATGVIVIDGDTVQFEVPAGLSEGSHSLAITAGAVLDLQGTPLEPFSESFTYDATAPRVIASSIAEGQILLPGNVVYTVRFHEELDSSDLTGDEFSLVGVVGGSFSPDTWSYDATTSALVLEYSNLPEDEYTLTLHSGDGQFEDLAGNDLDGDAAWPLPSGDGTPGGDFVMHFFCNMPPVVLAVAVNGRGSGSVSSVDPAANGIQTIVVTFSEPVNFSGDDVILHAVSFPGGAEAIGDSLMPLSIAGSGTDTMTITLEADAAANTWVKVTLDGSDTIADQVGSVLDGEPPSSGSGRGYLYDSTADLPSGEGTPGGDAVFYVGSLRAELTSDRQINDDDMSILLANWAAGTTVDTGDLTEDGQVNDDDLSVLLANWANTLDDLPLTAGTPPAPPMDVFQPPAMVQAPPSVKHVRPGRSRLDDGCWDPPEYVDALVPRLRLAGPMASNAFDVSDGRSPVAPSIHGRTLTPSAPARGKPSKPAARLIGAHVGEEFTDILSELGLNAPLQV